MNTNSKRLGIYLVIMLLATSVATTLRTVACVKHLDYASGFFTDKSLITAANIITLITVIGMFSYVFAAARIKLRPSFSTGATYVPAGLLGVATAFLGAKTLSYTLTTSKYPLLSVEVLTLKSPATLVGVIAAVLAFVSIAHHFFNAFIVEGKAEIRAYFAIATVAFLAFYAILVYLDSSLSINDSQKTLRQTAFLLSALFFLYEARISLGREMWRVYTAFGLAAASLAAYTSIPAIITYYVNGELISSASTKSLASLEEYILLLSLFVFILARICLTAIMKEEKENELIKVLGEYAKEREERTKESFERYQEIFAAKQLSIFDLYGGDEAVAENDEIAEEREETAHEEEIKEPTISDDAIYEAIFGKMPERPTEEAVSDSEPEPEDERDPEQIANDLLEAVDEALTDISDNKEKEN